MKPINLISARDSSSLEIGKKDLAKGFDLAKHESECLSSFIDDLTEAGADFICFSGYHISYSIKQISKEFDLIRISSEQVINIEIKSELEEASKIEKIEKQMIHNHYYLKFLEKEVCIYTYVKDDGLYEFDPNTQKAISRNIRYLIKKLEKQKVDYSESLDNLFLPKNYLISVFNDTHRFLNGEYFLTDSQWNIRKDIYKDFENSNYKVYCIPSHAGTGKTLLAYDIAKFMIKNEYRPRIIHCGKLNQGHTVLRKEEWDIEPIKFISKKNLKSWDDSNTDLIIVDESQRISANQLTLIMEKSEECKIPIVFLYDTRQYLRANETRDIYEEISSNFDDIQVTKRKLTKKIRTNKEMASFINNLVNIGKSKDFLDYSNITIEYFSKFRDARSYMNLLEEEQGWKAITFSDSLLETETISKIASICYTNAHDVIGQEFEKVVFVMDRNFRYGANLNLEARRTYYDIKGMLYQIVTRVVSELKIIVLDNPTLFEDLLGIKYCTFLNKD